MIRPSWEGVCQFCRNEIGAGHKPGCPYYVPKAPPRRFRPAVDALEDRALLAVVAVLGPGVDASVLPPGSVLPGYDATHFSSDTFPSEDTSPRGGAFAYIGTAVASIILRDAPGTRILPIVVSKPDGSISMDDVARGIHLSWAHGARIICCPLGSTEFDGTLVASEAVAGFRGNALIVAAAGDYGQSLDQHPVWPAADNYLGNVLSVAASDAGGNLLPTSDYGRRDVDLVAVGDRVPVILPGGNVAELTGTAFAAAHVAGFASRVLDARPTLSADQLRLVMQGLTTPLPALTGLVYTGGALLDATATTRAARPIRALPALPGELAYPFLGGPAGTGGMGAGLLPGSLFRLPVRRLGPARTRRVMPPPLPPIRPPATPVLPFMAHRFPARRLH